MNYTEGILRFAMGDALCIILSGYGNIRSPIVLLVYIKCSTPGCLGKHPSLAGLKRGKKKNTLRSGCSHTTLFYTVKRDILNLFHVRHGPYFNKKNFTNNSHFVFS